MLDILYPKKCMVCGKIAGEHNDDICHICKSKMPYIRGARCEVCSKAISNDVGICSDCRKKKHIFRQGFGLFTYDRTLENIIAGVKYGKRWKHLEWLSKELVYYSSLYIKRWNPQLIVPVPLHRAKFRVRGFNQAEIIAKEIARVYGIRSENKLLIRKKKTKPQKQLGNDERLVNLKNAFCLNKATLRKYAGLKRVLIIDDIYTTGATIDMCANELRKMGVENIYFLTLCIGNAYS